MAQSNYTNIKEFCFTHCSDGGRDNKCVLFNNGHLCLYELINSHNCKLLDYLITNIEHIYRGDAISKHDILQCIFMKIQGIKASEKIMFNEQQEPVVIKHWLLKIFRNALIDSIRQKTGRFTCGNCIYLNLSKDHSCQKSFIKIDASTLMQNPHFGKKIHSMQNPEKLSPPCRMFQSKKLPVTLNDKMLSPVHIASPERVLIKKQMKMIMKDLISDLFKINFLMGYVIRKHYFEGISLKHIAYSTGVCKKTVERIKKKSLVIAKTILRGKGIHNFCDI